MLQPYACPLMLKFSKGHNWREIFRIFSKVNEVIYSSLAILLPNSKAVALTVFEILCWQDKANRILGFLRRNFKECAKEVKAATYTTMVRPVLDYASTVWDPHQQGDIKTLEQVQRRAASYVYNDYTTRTLGCVTAMVKDSGWESLQCAAWISGCGHLLLLTTRGQSHKGQQGILPRENKQRGLLQLVLPSYHPGME